jgi:hypothetical protein
MPESTAAFRIDCTGVKGVGVAVGVDVETENVLLGLTVGEAVGEAVGEETVAVGVGNDDQVGVAIGVG